MNRLRCVQSPNATPGPAPGLDCAARPRAILRYALVFTLSVFVLAAAVVAATAEDEPNRNTAKSLQVVVHINFADSERQEYGLKNIENIVRQAENGVDIEVVCHGPGIGLLVASKTKHTETVQKLVGDGVRFVACENTMKQRSLKKEDLLHGAGTVPSGALEVICKQRDGYAYFKP